MAETIETVSIIGAEAMRLFTRWLDLPSHEQRLEVVLGLRPQPGDVALAFDDEAAARVAPVYDELWQRPLALRTQPEQTELRVATATVDDLLTWTGQAPAFPGGYRQIANQLRPGHTWVAFSFRKPGEPAGMAYDGLVRLDGRWAWFPKPYRFLSPRPRVRDVSHWTE